MAEESLRSALSAISRRLHEEVEAQLGQLSVRHEEELEGARRAAEAEAEARWAAKVEEVRSEWTARLEFEVGAARAEAERRMVAESMRLRVEAEQAAEESAARVRRELEAARDDERQRGIAVFDRERGQLAHERDELQAECDRLGHELQELQGRLEAIGGEVAALTTARVEAESALHEERHARDVLTRLQEQATAAAAEGRIIERQAQLAVVERILGAMRGLDAATSLSQVLSALLRSAALEAPRVALFVLEGTALKAWKAEGFGMDESDLRVGPDGDDLLGAAMERAEAVATSGDAAPRAPAFARLPADRAALAVPLLVGGGPVAVLYADDAGDAQPEVPASWPEAIQILSRHASVNLAHLTAARTAAAIRRPLLAPTSRQAPARSSAGDGGAPASEDGNSARRYARLLVSEIKLYNEAAVREGREQRDLLARLKPEIERARRLYEQRISASVDSRGALFQQELVQTLADGNPALLGGHA